jgi:glycosyltransferase involved in cell wall biosynthesis
VTSPRTLFVSHSGALGGAERSLLDLAAAWPGEREVVVLAEGPFVDALRARKVPVRVEPMSALGAVRRESSAPGLGALADVGRLAGALASAARGMDVLHANSQKAFVVTAAAGLLVRRPVVWHLRDILSTAHFSASNIRAAVFLANARAAAVIANSEATAAAFRLAGGRADLVHVVHNGIDPAPFDAVGDAEVSGLREALGAREAFVLGACARLAPWKGQHVVIAALEAMPDAHAWIIGAALFGEEAYAASLRAQAASLGVEDRVRFLGEREDVPALLRAADVVVHSAVDAEPFGRVVVEGMLARRPVIASDAGGVREILRRGETGWLVPPGDPAALAAAMREVRALDGAARDAICARAYADAATRFSIPAMVAGVVDVLARVAPPHRGGHPRSG